MIRAMEYQEAGALGDDQLMRAMSSFKKKQQPRIQLIHFAGSPLGSYFQFNSVQLLSCVRLFVSPWTAALQASLSITNSRSFLKLMSNKPVMPSNHLILCHPLFPPSVFPSIRVFSNDSVLRIRWPKLLEFQLQHQSFQ